ncbi:MAG: WbuC family cupin fold metalloprotein [Lentisphaeraceae bacterium]|nr:WbuC family cupin fold metalloprotein [Lentisphaeraceae bacterium]
MKEVDNETIISLCKKAATSPRKRSHLNLHDALDEDLQRLLIALQPGTYIRPHKHPEKYKKETLIILKGSCACLVFDDNGTIQSHSVLKAASGSYICEIPDLHWHSLICLEEDTVVLEFKKGPFIPLDDNNFAHWAPQENSPDAAFYLKGLQYKLTNC